MMISYRFGAERRKRWDLGYFRENDCCPDHFALRSSRSIRVATSIPLFPLWLCVIRTPDHSCPDRANQENSMYMYENVIRDHELRVAKSLERYGKRKRKDSADVDGYPLFAKARRAVRRT